MALFPSSSLVRDRVMQLISLRGGKLSPLVRLQILRKMPGLARLAYRLVRDERVPVTTKMVAGGALALIFSPIDVLQYIPVVGQVSDLVLAVSVLEMFVAQCPQNLVEEHRESLKTRLI